jgi:hypothetical protein
MHGRAGLYTGLGCREYWQTCLPRPWDRTHALRPPYCGLISDLLQVPCGLTCPKQRFSGVLTADLFLTYCRFRADLLSHLLSQIKVTCVLTADLTRPKPSQMKVTRVLTADLTRPKPSQMKVTRVLTADLTRPKLFFRGGHA